MIKFPSKQFRYVYWIIFVVRLLISTHVAYMYFSFSSESQAGKGWTFIEANVGKINYLPYATPNDEDKFYQSLLFNGCVYPTISWSNITYRDELCSIKTSDYKTFIVTPIQNKTRSDGQAFTLNDLYFTFNTILAENYWNIPSLDPYKSINVLADETGILEVIFPQASVDNMIFFTNFILPAHLLANKSLETYITSFYTDPVGTNCWRLQPSDNDIDSVVFDLSLCDETLLKYYQVKQFQNQSALETYLQWKQQGVDLVFSDTENKNYEQNKVVLNKFLTVFFNTQNGQLNASVRKQIAGWIHSRLDRDDMENPFLVKDAYLFDAFSPTNTLTSGSLEKSLGTPDNRKPAPAIESSTWTANSWAVQTWVSLPPIDLGIRELPTAVHRTANDSQQQEFVISNTIDVKQSVTMNFAEAYEKISITHEDAPEYFPESYNSGTRSSLYNFNLAYRNIEEGRNVYTIKAYTDAQTSKTFTLIINYLSKPTTVNVETTSASTKSFHKLTVIYFKDPTTDRAIEYMKSQLQKDGLLDFFTFESFDDSNTFAGKIESGDYDLVVREINMWLRKDISNLFTSSVPNVNPSRYTNDDLASAINQYFLADSDQKATLKGQIDAIWWTDVPLVILGKELDTINIRSKLDFPYPFRLYVLWRRKDFINDLNLFNHLTINRDRLFDAVNFKHFLQAQDDKK